MFYIHLNHVEFMACHGVLDAEKVTPQKFIVDVKIETDQIITAAKTDEIDDALNYVGVYELMSHIMMNEQHQLIETLAMKIATGIINKYSKAIFASVKVTKANPPIEGFIGSVSCVYTAYGQNDDA